MKKPGQIVSGSLVLAVIGFGIVVACSDQGEGDRCEIENGDSDCAAGLVCVPASRRASSDAATAADAALGTGESSSSGGYIAAGYNGVNEGYNTSDRCCPANRALATHPACVKLEGTTDAAPPPNTGPSTDASVKTDASSDAATEASTPISDASTDAPDGD